MQQGKTLIIQYVKVQSIQSLTKKLGEDLLTLTVLTKSIVVIFFAEKIAMSFCTAKAPRIFQQKMPEFLHNSTIPLKI